MLNRFYKILRIIYFINNTEVTNTALFTKVYFRWNIFSFSQFKRQAYYEGELSVIETKLPYNKNFKAEIKSKRPGNRGFK